MSTAGREGLQRRWGQRLQLSGKDVPVANDDRSSFHLLDLCNQRIDEPLALGQPVLKPFDFLSCRRLEEERQGIVDQRAESLPRSDGRHD